MRDQAVSNSLMDCFRFRTFQTNDLESAIVATLPANGASCTAIVPGVNNTTGIVVVEVSRC
jgi:hypothetical protein